MKSAILAVAAVLLLPSLQAAEEQLTCGTTPELVQWVRDSGVWSQLRARETAAKG